MYKLMIVEDEPLIREGLLVYWDWKQYGVTTIIEAENGQDGIDKGLLHQPDLIITDIRMPECNGIDMIAKLRPELPDSVFVILSGHEEFSYAQQAIRLGVTNYLLKPLQYEESTETIRICITKLESRTQKAIHQQELAKQLLLKGWIEQGMTEQEKHEISRPLGIAAPNCQCIPIVMIAVCERTLAGSALSEWMQDAEQRMISSTRAHNVHVVFYPTGSKLYILAFYEQSNRYWEIAAADLQEIVTSLRNEHGIRLYCGIGSRISDGTQLPQAFQQADRAACYRFFKAEQSLFIASRLEGLKGYPYHLSEINKRHLIQCIELADPALTDTLMCQFAEEVLQHSAQATPEKMFAFIQEIIGICIRFAYQHGIQIEDMYSKKLFSFAFLDDYDSVTKMFEWLGRFIVQLGRNLRDIIETPVRDDKRIFSQMETYILDHISEDVTLQMVADRFYYNPAYLSRLFKSKLQINYVTFLTDIRIRYAMECLRQPRYSISEIGEMCGYKSYKHFVKTFKKITCMTPSDYRKELGGIL